MSLYVHYWFQEPKAASAKETMTLPTSIVKENISGADNQEAVKNFERI